VHRKHFLLHLRASFSHVTDHEYASIFICLPFNHENFEISCYFHKINGVGKNERNKTGFMDLYYYF
jgi:hypothetical protein